MDDDLARRLIALRHSLDSQRITAPTTVMPPDRGEDPLAARFEKIFNKTSAPKTNRSLLEAGVTGRGYEHLSVEELINTLSSEEEKWALEKADEYEVELLLSEAKTAISHQNTGKNGKRESSPKTAPDWLRSDTFEDAKSDTNAEVDILQMIQDEIDLEAVHGIVSNEDDKGEPRGNERAGSPIFKLASFDEDLLKRFEALGGMELPPVPNIDPGVKLSSTAEPDETDTWCCICNDDAEYRCSGCENDIYCASCLYQAHTGPNAGYEERRHKWTKYTRPKKLAAF